CGIYMRMLLGPVSYIKTPYNREGNPDQTARCKRNPPSPVLHCPSNEHGRQDTAGSDSQIVETDAERHSSGTHPCAYGLCGIGRCKRFSRTGEKSNDRE